MLQERVTEEARSHLWKETSKVELWISKFFCAFDDMSLSFEFDEESGCSIWGTAGISGGQL